MTAVIVFCLKAKSTAVKFSTCFWFFFHDLQFVIDFAFKLLRFKHILIETYLTLPDGGFLPLSGLGSASLPSSLLTDGMEPCKKCGAPIGTCRDWASCCKYKEFAHEHFYYNHGFYEFFVNNEIAILYYSNHLSHIISNTE